ncbi:hypothetical protein OU798_02660 [Prolixibacteraceae bacterium Z1-6]|uniref:Uncharacterized protein n=1 Tax=Draconibacterium aestuarii TaxID=2998507 RepID=A0A9X3F3K6_9BACT|nr:hypothetical protein [Prolixibacteraceae bacterium Z1-6]
MKKRILSDHQKRKKRLITPINQSLDINETNHANDIIPEIIWLDILYCQYGLRETVEIITELTHQIEKKNIDSGLFNCCVLSCYDKLDDNQKSVIKNDKTIRAIFSKIDDAVAGFKNYFPNSPIDFLLTENDANDVLFVEKLKNSITNLFDRTSINSTYALTTVFHAQNCAGHLRISSKIEKFDVNEILKYPDTDESRRVAAFIRASSKPFILQLQGESNSLWKNRFWNNCYQIEPCYLEHLTDLEP